MPTRKPFPAGTTPEQRQAHDASVRRRNAVRRFRNDLVGFWRICRKPQRRRRHCCSYDPDACFDRCWPLVPEEEKEYLRACIRAAQHTRSRDAIHRAGVAARDAYLNLQARMGAASDRPAATPPRAAAPDARVRRL